VTYDVFTVNVPEVKWSILQMLMCISSEKTILSVTVH